MPARLIQSNESPLERKLKAGQTGDVRFDAFMRGRYATDASHYQIMPLAVVTPRGGGTSQAGQTVNRSVIVDCSRHINNVLEVDAVNRRCVVEPGIVLDELNRKLKSTGLWFPVDIS